MKTIIVIGESNRIENKNSMDVILRRVSYKFMTSSDPSEFVKSESYIIILSDRNEHAIVPTACLDANG